MGFYASSNEAGFGQGQISPPASLLSFNSPPGLSKMRNYGAVALYFFQEFWDNYSALLM
jgi:hypothetical protein